MEILQASSAKTLIKIGCYFSLINLKPRVVNETKLCNMYEQ